MCDGGTGGSRAADADVIQNPLVRSACQFVAIGSLLAEKGLRERPGVGQSSLLSKARQGRPALGC